MTEEEKNNFIDAPFIPYGRTSYDKVCTMCGVPFKTTNRSKMICSFSCRQEHNRRHARFYARLRRNDPAKKIYLPCIVCGFFETTDQHRENGRVYTLCPNHHCLITRNIKSLQEILLENGR